MKISIFRFPFLFGGHVAAAACLLGFLPSLVAAPGRKYPPTNAAGMPVVDTNGKRINYIHEFVAAISPASKDATRTSVKGQTTSTGASSRFVAATASTARPFWQYAIFGSGIGASNIVIGPAPAGGSAPEIIIGGNSWNGFGPDDFWQVIRHNSKTGNYDQVFVSPVYSDAAGYSASINRIGVANVVGDLNPEIVVMLEDGRIYLYDLVTKTELGHIETGISGLEGLSLADLDSDGHAELIVTTGSDLFVFNGAGTLLWQVPSAGGQDVVAGQMDDDPAIEIASSSGKVVDASTHTVQWTYNNGFAPHLRLAPLPGKSYQQLIAAGTSQVYAYDVGTKLPRWSMPQGGDAIQIGDVDNDGVPEVIIGDGQWGTVHVHDLVTQAQKWAVQQSERRGHQYRSG